jgi:aspartyl-tRNA(Asn)/glutamyl-tRNA(Gln) amidotransferase subunit A
LTQAGCGLAVEGEIAGAVAAAARLLEDAGAIVEIVSPFLTREMLDALDLFWRVRFCGQIATMDASRRARILPFIRDWAEAAAGADGAAVYKGFDAIMQMRARGNRAMRGFDFWVSPTAPVAAFAAELPCPTNDVTRPFAHIGFTMPFNMTEQPAASVNCGFTSAGLPIGLQIVGPRFDDVGVLRAAHAFQQMYGVPATTGRQAVPF